MCASAAGFHLQQDDVGAFAGSLAHQLLCPCLFNNIYHLDGIIQEDRDSEMLHIMHKRDKILAGSALKRC